MQLLADYIERRGCAEWDNTPFNATVVEQYLYAWNKLDLKSFDSEEAIEKPDFSDALNRFYEFAITLKLGNAKFRWEHKNGR